MLKAFSDRLRDLCQNDNKGAGEPRQNAIEGQTKSVAALARQFGILKASPDTYETVRDGGDDFIEGAEHLVGWSAKSGRIGKLTIPGKFGLAPAIVNRPLVDLRNEQPNRLIRTIEFVPATPLEYLCRWADANDLFRDDVRLESIIEWPNKHLSIGISQPQYSGARPDVREIRTYFEDAGWVHICEPSPQNGHQIYFNYPYQVLAMDAMPRNCYIQNGELLPFDVILSRPTEELEEFLGLYPK